MLYFVGYIYLLAPVYKLWKYLFLSIWLICIHHLTVFCLFSEAVYPLLKTVAFLGSHLLASKLFQVGLHFLKEMIRLVIMGFRQLGNNTYFMGERTRFSLLTRASEAYLWNPQRHTDWQFLFTCSLMMIHTQTEEEVSGKQRKEGGAVLVVLCIPLRFCAFHQRGPAVAMVSMAALLCLPSAAFTNT